MAAPNTDANSTTAKTCEFLFQSGGSKVQVVDGHGVHTNSPHSGAKALRLALPGEKVFMRRKVRFERTYRWVLVGEGK